MASSGWYTSGRPVTVPIGVANVIPAFRHGHPHPDQHHGVQQRLLLGRRHGCLTLAIQIAAEPLGAAEIA